MKVSNRELGDALGVSISMASRLRNGHRLPSIEVLDKIADFLKIDRLSLLDAHLKGAEAMGELLRKKLGDDA